MTQRHFENPFQDYKSDFNVQVPETQILLMIKNYVADILLHQKEIINADRRGDLYVGCSGIAFMFLKLSQSKVAAEFPDAIKYAKNFIDHSKHMSQRYLKRDSEKVSFLCGNAGIYAVSAMISKSMNDKVNLNQDLKIFSEGHAICSQNLIFNDYGNDEILFGRAGYLSGMYWLNSCFSQEKYFTDDQIFDVCKKMFESGEKYSMQHKSQIPLMYECYGDQYIGAAHGICAIYHMFLQSSRIMESQNYLHTIKTSIDYLLSLQSVDGNFPAAMDEAQVGARGYRLVHWCHGAPGVVYLFIKAYLVFKEEKYLDACQKCSDLVWKKGLLLKGPGICHGIAGNGYVHLVMYRLTGDKLYLYRAVKFAEFLTNETFLRQAKTPDHPFSLYEGTAGTISFLVDLLEPDKTSFPFMDVF
uniref:LanC-like protein 3 homolog n=1 Tax=Culicoides sonorensis TaxID=179676 RepID=A0A336KPA9_CULSO